MTKELKRRVENLLREITKQYDLEIEAMGIEVDHVHIFLSAPPKYSPVKIVEVLRSIGSKAVFEEFLGLKKEFFARQSSGVIGIS